VDFSTGLIVTMLFAIERFKLNKNQHIKKLKALFINPKIMARFRVIFLKPIFIQNY